MNRQPVESSNIKSIGYEEHTRTLEVEFHSGAVYCYANVPAQVHSRLIRADSVGSFFARHIKPTYEGTLVE